MIKKIVSLVGLKIGFIGLLFLPLGIFAFEIENTEQPVANDYVVSPGKIDVWLDPGSSTTREFTITNRFGREARFRIELEDFRGSRDIENPLIFLKGGEKGPYSLRDYLKPEVFEFTLQHGQRMRLPFEISIPEDAEPGGKYGAVIVSEIPLTSEKSEGVGVTILKRIAVLVFVRVKGEVKEDGLLKEFSTPKKFYSKPSVPLRAYFENNGNVHLEPYGFIKIKNILGKVVDEIEIKPFYVLPDSLRLKEFIWQKPFLFGKYTAEIFLNRGYGNIVDQKSFDFWVLPIKIIIVIFVVFIVFFFVVYWLINNIEIRRKNK